MTAVRLGLGGAPLGNLFRAVDDDRAAATVDAAWDAGVRLFDTAPHYGLGLSERRLGQALAGRPRPEFTVCTKVGRVLEPNPSPTGSDLAAGFDVPDDLCRHRDYSADGVRRSLDASLLRLGLDRVDIVLVHDADEHVEQMVTESLPALIELREQGVVGQVGVGMNNWEPVLVAVQRADVDIVMLAGRYTLLDTSGEPLLDACSGRDVAVLAAAPFASGVLARPWPAADATYAYAPAPEAVLQRARQLATVGNRHGVELPAAALQFALRHPAVTAVVAGMASATEVRTNVRRLEAVVTDRAWAELLAAGRAGASTAPTGVGR